MTDQKDNTKVKNQILGYGFMLEKTMVSEFKRIHPGVIIRELEEQTERPTIDVDNLVNTRKNPRHRGCDDESFFRAEPGFRPKFKVPSGRKIISFTDIDGKVRYKYED